MIRDSPNYLPYNQLHELRLRLRGLYFTRGISNTGSILAKDIETVEAIDFEIGGVVTAIKMIEDAKKRKEPKNQMILSI